MSASTTLADQFGQTACLDRNRKYRTLQAERRRLLGEAAIEKAADILNELLPAPWRHVGGRTVGVEPSEASLQGTAGSRHRARCRRWGPSHPNLQKRETTCPTCPILFSADRWTGCFGHLLVPMVWLAFQSADGVPPAPCACERLWADGIATTLAQRRSAMVKPGAKSCVAAEGAIGTLVFQPRCGRTEPLPKEMTLGRNSRFRPWRSAHPTKSANSALTATMCS